MSVRIRASLGVARIRSGRVRASRRRLRARPETGSDGAADTVGAGHAARVILRTRSRDGHAVAVLPHVHAKIRRRATVTIGRHDRACETAGCGTNEGRR